MKPAAVPAENIPLVTMPELLKLIGVVHGVVAGHDIASNFDEMKNRTTSKIGLCLNRRPPRIIIDILLYLVDYVSKKTLH